MGSHGLSEGYHDVSGELKGFRGPRGCFTGSWGRFRGFVGVPGGHRGIWGISGYILMEVRGVSGGLSDVSGVFRGGSKESMEGSGSLQGL